MMSNHAGELVVQESLLWWLHLGEGHKEHIHMVIGVELGKNGAEVHRRIMINAGDAVLNFLDLEFFVAYQLFSMRQIWKITQKKVNFGMP